jgi:pimeloyl-ACP methyl ester carboxylesterase
MNLETVHLENGLTQKVVRAGSSGPAVVYLHNAGGLTFPADPMVAMLASRYRVIAPVCPGFLSTPELDPFHDVHDLALHYDDLLDALGLEAVPVVGHSFGGMLAAEIAAHSPKRVSKLVLMSAVGLWSDAYPVGDLLAMSPPEMYEAVWGDKECEAARAAAAVWLAPLDPDNIPDAAVEAMIGLNTAIAAYGKFMSPIPERGLVRRLYRIRAEALILWGARDALVPPQYAGDFARGIRRSRVEIVDGAGHMLYLERPAPVLEHIRQFLDHP